MPAIDTILCNAVNPGAAGAVASVAASGDSLQVRLGDPQRKVYLEAMGRMGAAAGFFGVRSPALHDFTKGLRIRPPESPSTYTIPPLADQLLTPGDTLLAEIGGGAAETDIAWLSVYYESLGAIGARLHRWSELSGNVKNIKTIEVAVVSNAVIGAWADTLITATEDLLAANWDYAIMGYSTTVPFGCVGVRGLETGNLRICGPGSSQEVVTSEFFLDMDQKNGRPWVPVINSGNKGGIQVSVAANTASVAGTVSLYVAQLNSNIG